MGAYIYASGTYHPLEGNKVVSGGAMTAMKASDEIVVDGSRYQLGDNIPPSDVVSGLIISSGTSTYTSKLLKDTMIVSGGTVTMSGGKIQNIDVGSGGMLTMSGVNDLTSAQNLQVAGGKVAIRENSYIKNIEVNGMTSKTYRGYTYLENLSVLRGGIADTVIQTSGGIVASEGGIVKNLIISSGIIEVYPGGSISSAYITGIVYSADYSNVFPSVMIVSSGGSCCDAVIAGIPYGNASAYGPTISCYGFASNISVEKFGRFYVESNGIASNVVVASGGYCALSSGIVRDVTVSSGGSFFVYDGGIAYNVTSAQGAIVDVTSNGAITYANN